MPKVLSEFPKAKLVFIGYGPKETELKTQVKNLGLEEKIIFVRRQITI